MNTINVSDLILDGNARPIESTEAFIETEPYQSIKREGRVCVPIIVFFKDGYNVVWDGGRRVAAARLLDIPTVPYVEVAPPANDADAAATQVIYNNHRENLTYLQRAGLMERMKKSGYKQVDIAEKLGETEAEVSLALKALKAHPLLQKALEEGRISPSAVEPLLPLQIETQGRLAKTAIQAKTTRKVRALVQAHKLEEKNWLATPPEETYIPEGYDPYELMAIEELAQARKHLEMAMEIGLRQRDLRAQGYKTITQIVEIAEYLSETWSN